MSIVIVLAGALLVLIVGLFLLLKVVIVVAHLYERRPLRFLKPAQADDPEHARLTPAAAEPARPPEAEFNPYASPKAVDYATAQNLAAATLGFTPHGLFVHVKGGKYNVHAALWNAPDRRTLAAVMWGTIFGINASKTLLYSRTSDGKIVLTADKLPGNDTPGLYEIVVLQNAPFDTLVHRHESRLTAGGRSAVPFEGRDALADYEAILRDRHQFLIDRNEEYLVEPDRDAVRSTLKGACVAFLRSGKVPDYVERIDPGGGAPVPVGRPSDKAPAPLRYAEWFFRGLMAFSLFWTLSSPTRTATQALFRVALLSFTLVGLVTVAVLQFVLKRQAART